MGSTSSSEREHAARVAALTDVESLRADVSELRQAQTEAALLLALAERTANAATLQDVFDAALDATCAALMVPRAAILLFDDDGVMRFKAWRGLSETYRAAVDGHSPWRPEQSDPAPVIVGDVTQEPSLAAFSGTFAAERIGALAFFPLAYEGRLLGKVMAYSEPVRELSSREVRLAMAVSTHVAMSVVRQQAVAREREATRRLEAGVRAREEILSIVSHDLRTPLSGILTATELLERLHIEPPMGERVRRSVDSIRRLTARMSRLINDLMDFASIENGHFSIDPIDTSPEDIVSGTLEAFLAQAAEREIAIDARVASECPRLHADEERVVQALTNLVANAVSVTPRGGRIALVADCTAQSVRFSVADTGPGIHADELPHLFERYWRSPSAAYKGTGLGLPIAKAIVDAHGGRIWAESAPGRGSTFHFELPASARVG
ncbi:MAG: HAMP domain-containing histidine kinase [Deltaproteobacteria bacterium]|nr:HAMP domain-containing histidine kinase [Deltaproteobacteria bacterium]